MLRIIFLFCILFLGGCSQANLSSHAEPQPKIILGSPTYLMYNSEKIFQDTISDFAYPCNIDSVPLAFFHTWKDSLSLEFALIPDSSLVGINHGLGQWLRNNYGLWSRTCLVESFWEEGIFHPDDMSAILLTSYHRVLNGEPENREEQVEMFKRFWKEEMDIVYRLEDSSSWEFPPSMWDFGINEYK